MSDVELLRILLVNSKKIRDEKTYRANSYGILMTLFLSTEIFKNNIDIQSFLDENKILFKPYVFKSRTQVVGRICRLIEIASIEQLKQINNSINKIVFNENTNNNLKKSSSIEDNYFDTLLDQFKRNPND